MYCDNGTCKCGDIPHSILRCDDNWPGTVSVLDCYCLTYNKEKDTNEIGQCIFNCASDTLYQEVPMNVSQLKLNYFMCEENREGTLCGKCKDTFYPIAYSFDMKCTKCGNRGINILKYIVVCFLPLTIFCFIVLFFKINGNSPHLHSFIMFCQAISLPIIARVFRLYLPIFTKKIGSPFALESLFALYGIFNLDFFRSFDLGICLGTATLPTLSLDIVVGIYPLLLMILSYVMIHLYDRNFLPLIILWRPFKTAFGLFHRNWDIKTSVIDSYATFFLLSNVKLLSACFDLLVPTYVYQLNISSNTCNQK